MSTESDDEQLDSIEDIVAIVVPYEGDTDSISEESDTEEPTNSETDVEFDTNIPTTHKYLGRLNNVSGYTLYEDGEIKMMLAIHTSTIVLPGFTLPLVMSSEMEKNVMENYLSRSHVFALVFSDEEQSKLSSYGVTVEVYESYVKNNGLYLKAKGRQRCKILTDREVLPLAGRLQQLTVKILAEPTIVSPVNDTQLLNLKRRKRCVVDNCDDLMKYYKYRRYHLAQFSQPAWIYDSHELFYCVKLMVDRLSLYYSSDALPKEPISLSYWFIQNFELTHKERLKLMEMNTSLERLRLELKYLKMQRIIICATCKVDIAKQKDVFLMSKDGVQSNYCNPGGYVYETVTVSKAKNFTLIGQPSKQFSWFPGYAWTIMQCRLCRGHLGWQFTSKNLQPNLFYGLARRGFDIQIVNNEIEY